MSSADIKECILAGYSLISTLANIWLAFRLRRANHNNNKELSGQRERLP